MKDNSKKAKKIAVTLRITEEQNKILNKLRKKYGIAKSDIAGTLIEKYAKEEYGVF